MNNSLTTNFLRRIWMIQQATAGWFSIAILFALFATWAWADQETSSQVDGRYRALASDRFQQKNFPEFRLVLKRLAQINGGFERLDGDLLFLLAQVDLAEGNHAVAIARMRSLAPVDQPGNGNAQRWMAEWLRAIKPSNQQEMLAIHTELAQHLQQLASFEPKNAPLKMELGLLSHRLGNDALAEESFQAAALIAPEAGLLLAHFLRSKNEASRAKFEAERGLRAASEKLELNPNDLAARNLVAAYHAFLQNYREATETLKPLSEDDQVRALLVQLYRQQARSLPENSADEKLAILREALLLRPNDPKTLVDVIELSRSFGYQPTIAALAEMLAKEPGLAELHFAIGTIYSIHAQFDLAEAHFLKAKSIANSSPVILNNLAWTLLHQEHPAVDDAGALIDQASKLLPNHPEIIETRGLARLRQKRFQEAKADFEVALKQKGASRELCLWIAEACEGLGDPQGAAKFRSDAAELKK